MNKSLADQLAKISPEFAQKAKAVQREQDTNDRRAYRKHIAELESRPDPKEPEIVKGEYEDLEDDVAARNDRAARIMNRVPMKLRKEKAEKRKPVKVEIGVGDILHAKPSAFKLDEKKDGTGPRNTLPLLVWGVFRDNNGNVTSVCGLPRTTRMNSPCSSDSLDAIKYDVQQKIGAKRVTRVWLRNLFAAENTPKFFPPRPKGASVSSDIYPDLIVRRVDALLFSPTQQVKGNKYFDRDWTYEGVVFNSITAKMLPSGNVTPDIYQGFRNVRPYVPYGLTQETIDNLALTAYEYGKHCRAQGGAPQWPEPGTFPNWPEEIMKFWPEDVPRPVAELRSSLFRRAPNTPKR